MSSPHYLQSNGKAEVTVKSMKKILWAVWNRRYLDGDKLCKALLQSLYCKMDYIQPGSWLATHYKTWSLPTQSLLTLNGNQLGLKIALQDPCTKIWDK